jgi:hypothetical protein
MSMDYYLDVKLLRHAEVTDDNLKFSSPERKRAGRTQTPVLRNSALGS